MEIKISNREKEVLLFVAKGYCGKEIARILFLSPDTVKCHKRSLFEKFQAVNAPSLVYNAMKQGILSI